MTPAELTAITQRWAKAEQVHMPAATVVVVNVEANLVADVAALVRFVAELQAKLEASTKGNELCTS